MFNALLPLPLEYPRLILLEDVITDRGVVNEELTVLTVAAVDIDSELSVCLIEGWWELRESGVICCKVSSLVIVGEDLFFSDRRTEIQS